MDTTLMTTTKAFVVIGLLVGFVGLSAVVPARWLGIKPKPKPKLVLKDFSNLRTLSVDSDHNNIPDWRDMAIATMSTTTEEKAKAKVVSEEEKKRLNDPNNLTSSLSKNLYIASAYMKKNGDVGTSTKEALVNSILAQEKTKIITKQYTINDITLQKSETDASKKRYGNDLGVLMQKAILYKITEGDLEVMQAYGTNKDSSVLASLVIKRDRLDEIITKLTSMPVPYSATPYHLLALNRLSSYRTMLDGLSKAGDDPIRASLVYSDYIPVMKSLFGALNNMREYFTVSNITFEKSEPGYIFTSGYTIQ